MSFIIAPSVLSADFGRLAEEVRAAEEAGADWIHVDVMDGHFVDNLTIGPDVTRAIDQATSLPLDVHLMVENPERHIDAFRSAGADTIGVHVEACRHLHGVIQQIKKAGARACVVLNPGTPASAIEAVIPDVDQVLVMSVNPGFGGQSFIPEVIPKITEIRTWIRKSGRNIDLMVDGGIGRDTVESVATAGANAFVMGSAFFKSGDYKRFVEDIRQRLAPYA
ncbi:MAG: ribulose-phosphate 3-epimerase [Deltaproteobacteria bacterium]|nr:ribulose-phosphate 3-epimerase [Deltaproteobacteria bacterium]